MRIAPETWPGSRILACFAESLRPLSLGHSKITQFSAAIIARGERLEQRNAKMEILIKKPQAHPLRNAKMEILISNKVYMLKTASPLRKKPASP